MTLIELLSPRYKVITPWPGMDAEPFHLGQVVTLQRHVIEDGQIWIHMPIKHMPNSYMRQEFFDNFPHLFKKLEWWEDRKPEDMPEYVKWKGDGSIQKVFDWKVSGNAWLADVKVGYLFLKDIDPATEAEYLEYIKQKEG